MTTMAVAISYPESARRLLVGRKDWNELWGSGRGIFTAEILRFRLLMKIAVSFHSQNILSTGCLCDEMIIYDFYIHIFTIPVDELPVG